MVGRRRGAPRGDERGQLILIGAIAIALIVIGLVLVVNTALFTQVVGSEGTVEGTKDAGVAAEEFRDSASAVAHDENVQAGDASQSLVESTADGVLDDLLLNASLDGGGAYTNVSVRGASPDGTTIVQDGNGSFGGASGDWDPVPVEDDVGYLTLVIVPDETTGTFTVEVSEAAVGGETNELRIDTDAADSVTLSDESGTTLCTVDATAGTVRIDAYRGYVYEEDCQFDTFDGLDPDYTVEFHNTANAYGQYYVVREDDVAAVAPCSEVDCHDAIWSYDLTYEYHTQEVDAAADSVEVNVYD